MATAGPVGQLQSSLLHLYDIWGGQFGIQQKLSQLMIETRACLLEYVSGRAAQTAGQAQGRFAGQLRWGPKISHLL